MKMVIGSCFRCRLEFPSDPPIDRELKDLFLRILEKDPTLRITLEEIKVHLLTFFGVMTCSVGAELLHL